MNEERIKELQKEMKSLGILNIEADGNMSESLLQDAISVVRNSNIDIKEIVNQSKSLAKTAK